MQNTAHNARVNNHHHNITPSQSTDLHTTLACHSRCKQELSDADAETSGCARRRNWARLLSKRFSSASSQQTWISADAQQRVCLSQLKQRLQQAERELLAMDAQSEAANRTLSADTKRIRDLELRVEALMVEVRSARLVCCVLRVV
eukprot:1512749-Rhodomonas_salina.1